MDQLLKITTVPISIEIVVNRAKLNYDSEAPKVHVSKNKGGLTMEAKPIKINIDNTKVFDSIGLKKVDTLVHDYADVGIWLSFQATAKVTENGNQLLDFKNISPAQLAEQQNQRSIETVLSFLPKDGPDISWNDGTLNIKYQADDIDFDWDVNQRPTFEFIPASIEFNVKTLPRVDIEYVGEPIYCPPSANPNYVEPELDVTV